MSTSPTVDDLRLVEAVARQGSLGAAARELLVSQPAASQRLAALERRIGTRLFDRDTTGARPTAAGRELVTQAQHVLDHLDSLVERTLAAARSRTMSIATIPSLSGVVFAALDAELDDVVVQPWVDHGPQLVRGIEAGALDAAFVTIARQTVLPPRLAALEIARSELVTLLPAGVPGRGRGRRPYAGRSVCYCSPDLAGEVLHRRLADLGAEPRPGATVEAAIRIGRTRRCPVVVPELTARWYAEPGDRIEPAPTSAAMTLTLVSRSPIPGDLLAAVPGIRRRIADPAITA